MSHMPSVYEQFAQLHQSGCFIIPNPWDAGSAKWLQAKGFKALATTSAGLAWSKGMSDQAVPLEVMLDYIREVVKAVPHLPVNADFENGYAQSDSELHKNILKCVATGVAGLSIEDATGDPHRPLYDFETALRRIQLARQSIDSSGIPVLLTARAEAFLHGHPTPMPEVCKRLDAFAQAGADVLFAPGPSTLAQMREVIAAAGGKPVNIIVYNDLGLTLEQIAELGARRVSIGSALAKAAWTGFSHAVDDLVEGRFTAFGKNLPSKVLNEFFSPPV